MISASGWLFKKKWVVTFIYSYLKKNIIGSTSFILMFMYFGVGRQLLHTRILLHHIAATVMSNLYIVFL